MHTDIMKNIVFSDGKKDGQEVRIKILSGPLTGQEFQAKKVQEIVDGKTIYCYHISGETETYFVEKDILEI